MGQRGGGPLRRRALRAPGGPRRSEVGVSITPNFWDMGQSVKKARSYKENFVPYPLGQLLGQKKYLLTSGTSFSL